MSDIKDRAIETVNHLVDVRGVGEVCLDWHAPDFEPWRQFYAYSEKKLRNFIGHDLQPNNIVLGGWALDVAINPDVHGPIHDSELSRTKSVSVIERWVRLEDEVIRLSMSSTEVPPKTVLKQWNETAFWPGAKERRTRAIASTVLTSPTIEIDLYKVTGDIDDEQLRLMRYGANNDYAQHLGLSQSELPAAYRPNNSKVVGEADIWSGTPYGQPLTKLRISDAVEALRKEPEYTMLGRIMAARDNHSTGPQAITNAWESYIVHHHGAALVTGAALLGIATRIIEAGKPLVPTVPQDSLVELKTITRDPLASAAKANVD